MCWHTHSSHLAQCISCLSLYFVPILHPQHKGVLQSVEVVNAATRTLGNFISAGALTHRFHTHLAAGRPGDDLARSNSISNFEAAGHTVDASGNVPGVTGLRRNSVQVAALMRSGLQRTNSASKGLGWVCNAENGDPCFLPPRDTRRQMQSFAAPASVRLTSPLENPPDPASPRGAAPGGGEAGALLSLRTKSIALADPEGLRIRLRLRHLDEEEEALEELRQAGTRVTSFELCPVSRKSFYVPQTYLSRNSVIRKLPEGPAAYTAAPRAPGVGTQPVPARPAAPVAAARPAPAAAKPVKKKKGSFFKRIFTA